MKGTKELLILALPLMAAGCNGSSSTSPPPPPPGVDAEGIFEGTAGNGDSLFGIVASDGTAAFLEYPDNGAVPPVATSGLIVIPNGVVPDENGAFSVPFSSAENNDFTLPNGDELASTFSGTANTSLGTLSGTYLTKNKAPLIFTTNYDAASYEIGASSSQFVGTYSASFSIGDVPDSANVTIDSQGGVTVTEQQYGCNYSGAWAIPNAAGNAYEVAFGNNTSADTCTDPHGLINLQGLAALFNSGATMFAIMLDKSTGQGIYITMTKTS